MFMKKMFVFSEAYGIGHTKVAEAIKEGIYTLDQQWNVQVIELASFLRPFTAQLLSRVYIHSLRKFPKIWGHLYRKHESQPLHPSFDTCLYYFLYSRLNSLMNEFNPDVVLCTHPFPLHALALLKKRNKVHCLLAAVVTDYCAHASWINKQADRYFLPSNHFTSSFIDLGVPQECITELNGLPIRPSFWTKTSKSEARKRYGLKDMPTVLYMGGGLGIGLSETLLNSLPPLLDQVQMIIVTGHNRLLYERLRKKPIASHPNFNLFSYVDNINTLMDATDLLITKPGAVTCTEAIAKDIKMLLMNPIPGQEEENCKYFTSYHHIQQVENMNHIHSLIRTMLINEQHISEKGVESLHYRSTAYQGRQVIETILHAVSPQQMLHLSS